MARDFGITNVAPYASAPAVGANGATYWNTTSKLLYVSDGTAWVAPTAAGGGAVSIGADPPGSPTAGQLWWRSDPDGDLFIYYNDGTSSQFVPAVAGARASSSVGASVSETLISQTTTFTNAAEVTIYTKAITTTRGGGLLIIASPCISLAASATYTVTLRLKLDGATLTTLTPGAIQCTTNTIFMLAPTINWFVPPPVTAAAHTITVTAQRDAATGTATYRAMSFTAVEIA
jgi:hypothetical protein